jgi:hypothetical protein
LLAELVTQDNDDGLLKAHLDTGIRKLSLSCLIGLIPGRLAFWMAESMCFRLYNTMGPC